MIALDTSALISILNAEPEAREFVQIIGANASIVSTATLLEAHSVSTRWFGTDKAETLARLLSRLELTIVPFDAAQLDAAKVAYSAFGRGTKHKAQLNLGDCFSYALAKTRNLPLLFKGNDFSHTDIEPASKASI